MLLVRRQFAFAVCVTQMRVLEKLQHKKTQHRALCERTCISGKQCQRKYFHSRTLSRAMAGARMAYFAFRFGIETGKSEATRLDATVATSRLR